MGERWTRRDVERAAEALRKVLERGALLRWTDTGTVLVTVEPGSTTYGRPWSVTVACRPMAVSIVVGRTAREATRTVEAMVRVLALSGWCPFDTPH